MLIRLSVIMSLKIPADSCEPAHSNSLRIAWDIGTGWAELEMPSSGGEATRLPLAKRDNEGAASYVRVRGRGLCVRALSKTNK